MASTGPPAPAVPRPDACTHSARSLIMAAARSSTWFQRLTLCKSKLSKRNFRGLSLICRTCSGTGLGQGPLPCPLCCSPWPRGRYIPLLRGLHEGCDFVIIKLLHGKPVEGLVSTRGQREKECVSAWRDAARGSVSRRCQRPLSDIPTAPALPGLTLRPPAGTIWATVLASPAGQSLQSRRYHIHVKQDTQSCLVLREQLAP